ncbi:MAG: thiamine diphosphokinase [bacterium TMED198]|nr:MAG: thiamine diphosphokinase [bacterium TMED198]
MPKIKEPVSIVANGDYPSHNIPLNILKTSKTIVCCDGAINSLEQNNISASFIVGDMDSIEKTLLKKYSSICIHKSNQNENDLRKALKWLNKHNIDSVSILAATGKREDHSIFNILSMLEIEWTKDLCFYTDHGVITLVKGKSILNSHFDQDVSIFFIDISIRFTTEGLKYEIDNQTLSKLYMGSLNKSIGSKITIKLSHGKALIFQSYKK